MPVKTYCGEDATATELTGLYELALDSADTREIAREALALGLSLAFGKVRKGKAVLRLQELTEALGR